MGKHIQKTAHAAKAEISVSLGLAIVLLFFAAGGYLAYSNTENMRRSSEQVAHTHDIITALDRVLSTVKDAETGQRGFVLTGNASYLEPYNLAVANIDEDLSHLGQLVADDAPSQVRLSLIKNYTGNKLKELAETVELRQNEGFEAARDVVVTDRGKNDMQALRREVAALQAEQRQIRAVKLEGMAEAYRTTLVSGVLASVIGILLSVIVGWLVRRAAHLRQQQEWLQRGEVGFATAMLGEQRVDQLAENALSFISRYTGAQAGAFYNRDGSEYRRIASHGAVLEDLPESFKAGEGLLGQSAKDGQASMVHDVPEGYLRIGSALGRSVPKHLLVVPAVTDDGTNAVVEFGYMQALAPLTLTLLERISEALAVAVKSANYRAYLQNLLEETQRQGEELQAQSEELRVTNEELEEQSRALKESQARLEQQHAEMEQTNAQLEEQTQMLEDQRDNLDRAKSAVQLKAQELEQASQYKSDFLANMSHELRTPLNSSLILAKLLADNSKGNLTPEQVKFAQTIQSSGNDLLALINDILDLSKIEAGHMEIRPEPVTVQQLAGDLERVFEPLAGQKGITLKIDLAQGCPPVLDTDRQRLEQVLKNLLSNAIKFTESGTVELSMRGLPGERIAFAVSDTGIGIPDEQQQAIFDAFRQADGTISRKFGGTGLGLSISRELVRLLGGEIAVKSVSGEGSVFTVTLPEIYDPAIVAPRSAPPAEVGKNEPSVPSQKPVNAVPRQRRIEDDRAKLNSEKRILLVVEDDESFARILYDMAHELDFQCLIAMSAEEALAVAKQYLPSAVVLDVGLPDHSGLSVLDRLKRDARTRHIPVHVVSAADHAQTALSLGAVGYMLKPVKREELADSLRKLETRLAQRMRHVLIVEDDPVQRDSLQQLLGSHDVKTDAVGTAAECLEKLGEATFDCMVLDLTLPDATGYSLLETLSREDAYSFPPVIVYTGRDLSGDEEQRLRRYSKSIIIKGAKSPERLLDEVTLFLHQVVSDLPPEQQKMLEQAKNRDAVLENRHILVVEDDVRNVYALTNILEPFGAIVHIARNGREALDTLTKNRDGVESPIDLVLMDVMMPEMDGLTATRMIRQQPEWKKLPVIMLTAKAMKDDQERCLEAGANDYMAKPLDVEKLLSLVRVWMPR